jgi:hypothetical protein
MFIFDRLRKGNNSDMKYRPTTSPKAANGESAGLLARPPPLILYQVQPTSNGILFKRLATVTMTVSTTRTPSTYP